MNTTELLMCALPWPGRERRFIADVSRGEFVLGELHTLAWSSRVKNYREAQRT